MRSLFVLLFSITSHLSISQESVMMFKQGDFRDLLGRPVSTKNEYVVDGSVYLYDTYLPGSIVLNKKKFINLPIKLDVQSNQVLFKMDEVEMIPAGTVSMIEFFAKGTNGRNQVFRNGFPPVNKNTNETYYEVLDTGKATLLKHIGVVSREAREYGDAAVKKTIQQVKNFYIFIQNRMVHVKKADALLEAMKDKRASVEAFISANKIKLYKDDDVKSLINYYNNL